MDPSLNQTLRGGSLKDFQVLNKLGEGSFSQVFKVKRHGDGQEYAMKKVKMQLLKEKEKENALNEVRILASLSDEYIVGYKEAFIDNNELYVIMEYCPKGDIMKIVGEHQKKQILFEEKEVWKAIIHMLKGLKSLHEMNILHRDLKCANVFINKDGIYKLGDLNVSKIAKRGGLVYTQTGTPYYAAPEVWKDKPYDSKCDIWSLGCVAYEMCSLKPPFRAQDMEGLYKKIQKGVFEKIPPKYSSELYTIIQSCLRINPASRPSAAELLNNSSIQKYQEIIGGGVFREQPEIQNLPKQQLLQTIKVPRNLGQLKGKLPKAQYQKKKIEESDIISSNKSYMDPKPVKKDPVVSVQENERENTQIRKNRILSAGPCRGSESKNTNNYHYRQHESQERQLQLQKQQQQIKESIAPIVRPPLVSRHDNNAIPTKPLEKNNVDITKNRPISHYQQNNIQKPPRYSNINNDHLIDIKNNNINIKSNNSPVSRYRIPASVHPHVNKENLVNKYEYLYQKNLKQYQDLVELKQIYQSQDQKSVLSKDYQPPHNHNHRRYVSRPYSAKDLTPSKIIQNQNQELYDRLAQKEQKILGQYDYCQYRNNNNQNQCPQSKIQRNYSEKNRINYNNNNLNYNKYSNIRQSYEQGQNYYQQQYDPSNYIHNANYYGNGNRIIKKIL